MRKITYLKITLLSLFAILGLGIANAQYFVNFEGETETKTAYASGSVTLSGIEWNLTEAVIGDAANDWKNGTKSLRLRARDNSLASMNANKTTGVGTISFSYRRYGSDGSQQPYAVEYSTDSGEQWITIANITGTATVQEFNHTLNIEGNIRIRLRLTTTPGTTGDRRLNIDDILLTDYPNLSPTITLNKSAIANFNYVVGNGPSNTESFSVEAVNLTGTGNATITLPAGYEISTTKDGTFSETLELPYASGTFTNQPITLHLRLKAGLTSSCSYNGDLTITGGSATNTLALSGFVNNTLLPELYNISNGSFNFSTWDETNACRSYPEYMRFWITDIQDNTDTSIEPIANYTGVYNATSASRITGLGVNGVSFVITGSEGQGRPLGAVVGLNTTGRQNITVTWTGGTVTQGDGTTARVYNIKPQYKIADTWNDIPNAEIYTSAAKTAGSNDVMPNVVLPSTCNNQPAVYVRWIYYAVQVEGAGGSRPQLSLSNISISSSVPTSAASASIDTWTLKNKTLYFDVMPSTNIEVYSVTGSKVASFEPAMHVALNLSKGIYIVKVNKAVSKIILK